MEDGFLEDNEPIRFIRATKVQDAKISYRGKSAEIPRGQIRSREVVAGACRELGLSNELEWILLALKARESFTLTQGTEI